MSRHANPNQTTTETETTAPPRRGEAWWQTALFIASLIAVIGLLAGFEYQAGYHAGFGAWVSVGVPLAFDAYALWTWLDPDRNVWDELAAVGILAASVALSIAQPPPKWQALGIGMIAIVVEWRIVARRRDATGRAHALAVMADQVQRLGEALAEAQAGGVRWREAADALAAGEQDLRRRLADAETAAAAWRPATTGGGRGGPSGGAATTRPEWGTTKAEQIEWLRGELAAGREFTGQEVSDLMGLGSRRTGGDRLAEARKPHLVAREA